jgi:hypothetical protein
MVRSDTGWVVARVTHHLSGIGQWAICEHPRETGSNPSLAVYPQLPVPVVQASACPHPTVIGLVYERPEAGLYYSFLQRCSHAY